jgi:hypothetical protein
VEIRYTAQREDVGALLRYNLRHSPRLWAILVAVALFPVGLVTAVSLTSGRWPARGEVAFDLILGLGLVAVLLVRARSRTKSDERVLAIGPAGIYTTIGRLSADLPWARIVSVDVTPEYIFITGRNANGLAIPSRAFESHLERAEFVRQLEAFRSSVDHQPAI